MSSFYFLSLTTINIVIGETIVTPSSIVFLLVKLRITPPGVTVVKKDLSVDETKRLVKANDAADEQFLSSRLDAEELDASLMNGSAHAPFWPGVWYIPEIHFYFCLFYFLRPANLHGGSC